MIRVLNFNDSYTSASAPSVGPSTLPYNAVVSSGSESYVTHATWALLEADIQDGWVVLVKTLGTINATMNLTKSNCTIVIDRNAIATKGSATTGLLVTGDKNLISGGTFSGFSSVGDKAVSFASGADNNNINGVHFLNCTANPVDDNGTGNTSYGHTQE